MRGPPPHILVRVEPPPDGLATLCAHAAHAAGAERAFWCSDAAERLVAGPRAMAPREVEWRWVEERRRAGPGVTRRGRGRLRRGLRDGGAAELWLVRGDAPDGAEDAGGVLGLEFAHAAPRRTDEVALRALCSLARLLEGEESRRRAGLAEREHAARGRHAARLVHDLRHELTLARVLAAAADSAHGRVELGRVLDGCAELCARALTAPDELAAPEPVRAVHALRRAVEDVRRSREHARHLALEVEADEDLVVLAERTTLARVLANALANAVEATPRGGRVRLRAVRASDEGANGRDGVELAIDDEGRGIDRRRLERLASGDALHGLHGHGFASAHAAARALGGELRVASTVGGPGSGTRVRLLLPAPRGREAIVVLDPLRERRGALAAALERAGWGCVECADAREALRALNREARAVALARGAGTGRELGTLVARTRALGLPCLVLDSALDGADARARAAALTARLPEVVPSGSRSPAP